MFARKLYYLRKVQKQQWLRPKELENLQKKKLRAVIKHAFKFVPYYRRKWKAIGVKADDIKNVDDLKKLPTITKKDLVQNFDLFIATNYKHLYKIGKVVTRSTSGTSGAPSKMFFDERAWDYLDAIYLRSLMVAGYNPKEPLAYYWYEPFEKKVYNRFGFMNKIYISCNLSEEEQLKILQRINSTYIYYFPSILYSISKKMAFNGIKLSPKSVITHAEIISKKMKKTIQNAFNARVYDQYGTSEFNRIAWECGEGVGYHVDIDSVVLEVDTYEGLKSAVLTGLTNYIIPLIRYEMEDIIIPTDETCSCRRGLPLIKSIDGRLNDLIKLKSGKYFSPKRVIDSISDLKGIYKFRVSYKGRNKFEIQLVLLDNGGKIFERIDKRLKSLFKEPIEIKFKILDEIKKNKGGKRNMVNVV